MRFLNSGSASQEASVVMRVGSGFTASAILRSHGV